MTRTYANLPLSNSAAGRKRAGPTRGAIGTARARLQSGAWLASMTVAKTFDSDEAIACIVAVATENDARAVGASAPNTLTIKTRLSLRTDNRGVDASNREIAAVGRATILIVANERLENTLALDAGANLAEIGKRLAFSIALTAATIRLIGRAAFPSRLTPRLRIGTTQLFAKALALATGVVTTLGVIRVVRPILENPILIIVAAIGSTLAQPDRANTRGPIPGLHTRTRNRSRRRRRPPRRLDTTFQGSPAHHRGAAQTKHALEHTPPAGAARQRLDERIETSIIHSRTSLNQSFR